MDYESILMGMINSRLTSQVNKAQQAQERESRGMPNSTRRAFESRMKTDAGVYRVAAQNMEDGKAMVNVAQTTTTAIKSQLQEVRKILTDASVQDSLTSDEYTNIKQGLLERFKEIENLATNASFNGMKLMDGSAGTNGTVELQAGYTSRDQNFMNLLDGSSNAYQAGATSMDLSEANLTNQLGQITDQASAQTALARVNKFIDGISALETRYSNDYKALDNWSMLFEEQADIFDKAGERSAAFDKQTSTLSQTDILSQLLSNDSSILSGTT
ncbi:MAG: hypothetical protein IJT59_04570 [Desulfovibrionaceae bacterium]|nr:hypothetical protein [Desulfovibrionaceae bacterium]